MMRVRGAAEEGHVERIEVGGHASTEVTARSARSSISPQADAVFLDESAASDIWQAFAVLLPVRTLSA